MARKKQDSLSTFSAALDDFGFNNSATGGGVANTDNIFDDDDIDDLGEIDDVTSNIQNTDTTEGDDVNGHDDDSDIPDNILNNNTSDSTNPDDELNNHTDDVTEDEMQNVGLFFDAFAEELGWDVEDDNKPSSVSELIDYMENVMKENSTPQYGDDRIRQLDEYVKNGGNFEDFYHTQQQNVSYDNMDMEDESNQKAVIREYLRYQGLDDEKINRKIERYEDGDLLEEEAQDAMERMQAINEQRLQAEQLRQQELRQAQEEQAREFMNNLTNTIGSLENIRGIAIPKADRRELFDYITKVDADGLTRYQKDFNANMVNNLIESAYFTMKGDTLLGEAKRSGRTSAANKLRTMLRHQSTNHSRYNVDNDKQRSVVDLASQFYR